MNVRRIMKGLAAPRRLAGTVRSRACHLLGMENRWARNLTQLAIVIPLDEECSGQAHEIQRAIRRKYGNNPGLDSHPHITLKMGFPATDAADFGIFVKQVAAETAPFEIGLRDFGHFDEGILFLNVEASPALETLRQHILTGLAKLHGVKPEAVEGPMFHFHVTLAYGLPKESFAALKEEFSSKKLRLSFLATHIELFRHTGCLWETCERAALSLDTPPTPLCP